ncbi:MAG: MazG family protein, partial [Clostridia bacterium]|nr:MazG family protein [Clostridia bacterium]
MNKLTKEQRDANVRYLLEKNAPYTFDDLVTVVELLRSEGGCPWDMEQTHKSIRNDFIEETYEVIEAIDTEDPVLLREELGDVLLQVVFHARIEQENDVFGMAEVSNDICAKLIHRHPHVFGTVEVENSAEVLKNWEAIKGEEKQRVTVTDKLRAIPPMYPALMRAQKVDDLYLQGKKPVIVEMQDDLITTPGVALANTSFLRDFFKANNVPVYLESRTT